MLYELIKTPKSKEKKTIGRVRLTEESEFPGVIVELINVKLLKKDTPTGNVEIKYNVLKAPKKYRNMDDSYEQKFKNVLSTVFSELIERVVKAGKKNEK